MGIFKFLQGKLHAIGLVLIFGFSFLTTSTASAAPYSQSDDPTSLCAEGRKLFDQFQDKQALPLLEAGFKNRETGNFKNINDLGYCAWSLGVLRLELGDTEGALEAHQFALAIFTTSGDKAGEIAALKGIGFVYTGIENYEQALEHQTEAVRLAQEIGDLEVEADGWNNIGDIYIRQGRYDEAIQIFNQVIQMVRQLGNKKAEGTMLYNIGVTLQEQGLDEDALDYYQGALSIAQEIGDKKGEARNLLKIGDLHYSHGRYQDSLDYYQQGLALAQSDNDLRYESVVLNDIGLVFVEQGRETDAIVVLEKALEDARAVANPGLEGSVLNNMGLAYHAGQDLDNAEKYYKDALKIFEELNTLSEKGHALHNLGNLYGDKEEYEKAVHYYQLALAARTEAEDFRGEGMTLSGIGTIYASLQQYETALNYHQQALKLHRKVGNRVSEAATLFNIGNTYQKMNSLDLALSYYEESMDILESVRSTAGSEKGRANFIAQFMDVYDDAIGLYYEQALYEKAFYTAERGRARAFLDSLATGHVQLSDGGSDVLLENAEKAQATLQALKNALQMELSSNSPDSQLINDLKKKIEEAQNDYRLVIEALDKSNQQLSSLLPGSPNVARLSNVQALLDNQTTMVSYWVQDNQTYAFIVTRNHFYPTRLDVSIDELVKPLSDFYNPSNLTEPFPKSMISLYKILIDPIKGYLKTEKLIIIPHSILNLLPFAALTDGKEFLSDQYIISYIPSASTLPFIQSNAKNTIGPAIMIYGNPTTGNLEGSNLPGIDINRFDPLPYAELEAKEIATALYMDAYINKSATETLIKQNAHQIRVLHLAAYGVFNLNFPLDSFIALAPDRSNDGWLTVGEIYGLDLHNSSLVVLSACATQLGELSAGDEFVGLTRAFLFSGTPTVIASLWNINDKATASFMRSFYLYLGKGMSKGEALQKAQIDTRSEYPNPFYWAAFVLSGDPGTVSGIGSEEVTQTLTPVQTPTSAPIRFLNCGNGLLMLLLIVSAVGFTKNRGYLKMPCSMHL